VKRLKDQGATSLSRLDESTSDLIDPKKDPVKRGTGSIELSSENK